MPWAIGLFLCISALVALCAKHKVTREHATNDSKSATTVPLHMKEMVSSYTRFAPGSPLPSPRKLITTIGNKANMIPFPYKKRSSEEEPKEDQMQGGYGEGGVWQKNILLGEKCQPLQFSGSIFYDNHGNPLKEMPRSPRVRLSPLPSFASPAAKGLM